ncbi:RING finger protein 10 [Sesamum angolense]|uniref:RING finger protein 10 n=1 Tax=Sesamum angolense TaxID=2727404 RepID=A0AAE2C5P9_9LAMI|nr:RING finger protein 10 [Sesamum angolense]
MDPSLHLLNFAKRSESPMNTSESLMLPRRCPTISQLLLELRSAYLFALLCFRTSGACCKLFGWIFQRGEREGRHNHGKNPINQDGRRTLHPEDAAHAQIASMDSQGKASGTFGSPSSHQSAASSSPQTSSGHLTGKKPQMVSGNHLLNFHYDPIPVSRPQPRAPPRRKEQKRKPYNKDLFFQANYKFVVLDSGTYAAASLDPDKMLCWDDIICLKYSTPLPVQCPICLDDPLCPQITSCGHIFCFPCILQYFSVGEDDIKDECWKKCPLCFTMISSKDLYTICIEKCQTVPYWR